MLFTFVTVALGVLHDRQETLLLEGNRLYSSDALSLDADPARTVRVLAESGASGRIFAAVSEDGSVRSLATVGQPSRALPIHSGRQPREGDDRVALVGSAVDIEKNSTSAYYEYGSQRYAVIGVLGLGDASLAADQVLLVDRRLFERQGSSPLVVDSVDSRSVFAEEITDGRAVPVDQETGRRADADGVSALLATFGHALTLVGYTISGALAGARLRRPLAIARIVGSPPSRVLLRGSLSLIVLASAVGGVGLLASAGLAHDRLDWPRAVGVVALQSTALIAAFVVSATRGSSGRPTWK